jgi:hypothetical protein
MEGGGQQRSDKNEGKIFRDIDSQLPTLFASSRLRQN